MYGFGNSPLRVLIINLIITWRTKRHRLGLPLFRRYHLLHNGGCENLFRWLDPLSISYRILLYFLFIYLLHFVIRPFSSELETQRRVLKVRVGGGWESMDFQKFFGIFSVLALVVLVCITCSVKAGDIVHGDDLAPKKPRCENDFVLV